MCRVKRAFEAALPPLNDLQQLPRRQQYLEAWETQEWADKEELMEAKQASARIASDCQDWFLLLAMCIKYWTRTCRQEGEVCLSQGMSFEMSDTDQTNLQRSDVSARGVSCIAKCSILSLAQL